MILPLRGILLGASLAIGFTARSQPSLDDLARNFVKYVRADRKEKLIVFTDMPFYSAGETIWLKAWCVDSLSNRPFSASKNLFVDLVNDKDSVISQLLFNIPGHMTAGKIVLPTRLGEGYYWLRAYTARMLRGESSGILVKPIYILNPRKPDPQALNAYSNPAAPKADSSAPTLLFYPEGGSIISGATATVAYRCTSPSGQPVDISGYVTDPLHDTVTRFSSTEGMGKFSFDAYNPRKYTAHVRWANREVLYPLPAIDQYASRLSVIGRDDKILKLQVSLGDSLYKKHKTTRILGMSRGSLYFAAIGTDMYQVNVPLADFPAGKARFFLFDDQDRLVSQRNAYIRSDGDQLVAATDKAVYSPGDKVDLRLAVIAPHDNPASATPLSVAVTDDRLTGDSSLLQPNDNTTAMAADAAYRGYSPDALDALMLTEAPSYSGWENAPAAKETPTPLRFADSNLLYIRGKAVNRQSQPLQHHIVVLFSDNKQLFLSDTTDDNGRFEFPLTDYNDGTSFNMKLTTLNGKATEGKLVFDKFDFPEFRTPRSLKSGLGTKQLATIRQLRSDLAATKQPEMNLGKMLKPALVKGHVRLPPADEARRLSPFSDVIGPDELRLGAGPGRTYNALSNVPGFTINTNRTLSGKLDPFLVVMDGVEVAGAGASLKTFFEQLDESSIEFIEVLKGPLTALYGVRGGPGVILIYTVSKIADVAQTNDRGLATIYPKGYYNQSDVYADSTEAPTLYWNGNILTGNDGKATVDFFTGRRQAVYSAAIVGVTAGGEIVEGKIKIRCQ